MADDTTTAPDVDPAAAFHALCDEAGPEVFGLFLSTLLATHRVNAITADHNAGRTMTPPNNPDTGRPGHE